MWVNIPSSENIFIQYIHTQHSSLVCFLSEECIIFSAFVFKLFMTFCLKDLNFLEVKFDIFFEKMENPTRNGYDEIEFMISTNPGSPLRPLGKVASGGELSRIMLAIKTVLSEKDGVETLIFDEIDTGISGRTAQKVSEKLSEIAQKRQVLCITHLAQIAAMADSHYVIKKSVTKNKTVTEIQTLSQNEMIEELARILGGAEITETIRNSAKEMKDLAKKMQKRDNSFS